MKWQDGKDKEQMQQNEKENHLVEIKISERDFWTKDFHSGREHAWDCRKRHHSWGSFWETSG
jgi:hypothetical protein